MGASGEGYVPHLPKGREVDFLDAASGRAGLGENEVTIGAAERLARQAGVAHELEELTAVHVNACLHHLSKMSKHTSGNRHSGPLCVWNICAIGVW